MTRAPVTTPQPAHKVSYRLRLIAERFEQGDWDDDFKDAGVRVTKIIPIILRMVAKAIEDEAGEAA